MSRANPSTSPLRTSPFHEETLVASSSPRSGVHARVRLATDPGLDVNTYVHRGLGDPVRLRPMERRLLSQLRVNINEVVPTRDLIAMLYGNIDIAAGRTRLKRLVADVRSRLGPSLARRLQTVHGIGLMWVDE